MDTAKILIVYDQINALHSVSCPIMKPQIAMWFFNLPTLVAVWTPRLSTGSLIHSLQPNSGAAARCKAEEPAAKVQMEIEASRND